ncbi:hypothetical protein [Paraburkholderia dipogonis]|uniref:hypothetical protein n=1 Tax=Paraburkholderia dipogonis TaxID=1211383 RepID=UPI0038B7283D
MKTVKVMWALGLTILVETSYAQEIYLQGGTQGIGIGAALAISSWFGLHADFNAINFSHNFSVGGNRYEDGVRLRQGGIYGDFFPWSNSGLRIIAGLRLTDDEVSGNSVPTNGTYTFKGKTTPAFPGEYATATVKYPTAMPYLGVGYGFRPAAKGFGLTAELGVAYGIPHSSYSLSPALTQAAGPALSQEIAATGLQQLREKASPYRWYPTVQIGISYHF